MPFIYTFGHWWKVDIIYVAWDKYSTLRATLINVFVWQRKYDGEEMFWYETTVLMVDGVLKDDTLEATEQTMKATRIVKYALDVFAEILRTRPNRRDVIGFIIAKLEAK